MNRPMQSPGPTAGHLEGTGVARLLADLARRNATGTLQVNCRHACRRLFVERGRVVFASSSDPNDRLGEYLLRAGKVTLAQLEQGLSEQSSAPTRLGTLLVQAGALGEEELPEVVRGQFRAIVFDLLTWTEGSYRFEEASLPDDEDILLETPWSQLLLEGVQQATSMRLVESGTGSPRTVFHLTPGWRERTESVQLPGEAQAIVEHLETGQSSVETLCREICYSGFEVYRTLWALRLIDVVEPVVRRADDAEFQGNLEETSIPELLIRLENDGETGVLYVNRGTIERSIQFAAGRCVFATSSDPDDGLVNYLFRRGVISLRDKEETARRLLSNKRVGTILRELGVIDDADLQAMVRGQVSEVVCETIGWEEGEYSFVRGPLPHAEDITLNASVASLIAEGVRRVTSWTRLMRGCGGLDNPLCLSPHYLAVLDSMDASVAEWEIVNALKSPQTPRRVCRMTELNDLRACQILWALRVLGAAEDSPIDLDESSDDDAMFDDTQAVAAEEAEEPQSIPAEEQSPLEADPREVEEALRSLSEQSHGPDRPCSNGEDELPTLDLPLTEIDGEEWAPAAAADEADDTDEYEPEEPHWEVSEAVEQTITRFNAMHRVVFRVVRSEIGAGAANFVLSSCERVDFGPANVLEGVELHSDGSWDVEGLKRVVVEKSVDNPWDSYQRVLEQEFQSLEPHLGEARSGELKQKIWEIEQASYR